MAVSRLAPANIQHPVPAGSRRWLALALVLVAVFMDLIDITVVVIAAPSIQNDLGTSYSAIQWVMAGYVLALGLLLITGGRLGDIFGRKRLFLTGVALFTAASAACGLAPTIDALVVARAVQGAAAALMVPQVLATIQVEFRPAERPRAFGLYGAVNGLAAAAGPIVGGLLVGTDAFGLGWRSVFWINVPIGLGTLLGAAVLLRESRAAHRPRLDVPGVIVLTAGLMLLLYPLIQGAELGWPAWGWLSMVAALVVLAGFARYQAARERAGYPLVPASLFRRRSFVAGLTTAFVVFSSVASVFLVLTIQLQAGHNLSPVRVSLIFMAWPLGLMASSGLAIRLVGALGTRLIALGSGLLAATMAALILTIRTAGADLAGWHLVPGLLVGGIGFGLVAPVLTDIVLSAVPTRDAGVASGVTNTVIQVASAMGIGVVGAIFATALARGRGFDAGAADALWYPLAAFLLGLVLCRWLPAHRAGTA